ncbi:enoyl-CoA hydratase/isomerase family protein [Ornithinimicrobium tianjinense]|uniref:Enoyl-CoA hydratase n=1 Tax=Ornithinimicrobium tianjinense TaxID=1195761 RepID=A0A917BWI8_9MICO|nr:enoyl-CoA hydratase-related protein [Ornithinimicrobium tianjinense]GGF59654.1 enoyl-CoA hydratase [Ornithinimicrobium tianjinense]
MSELAESSSEPVLVTREAGVATVTLNRPDAMNSLDVATKESLLSALQDVASDPEVRCVVLTGTGRAFSVGQDLKEHVGLLAERADQLWTTVSQHYNPVVELIATMDKPVVAAVNGVAAGAGAAFAFAADLRYVAASAGFNLAFTGIGLSCDSGSSWSLPRLIGPAKAKELLFFPRTVKAEEALQLGLATEVVADEQLSARVEEVARGLAAGPTLAYGAVRRAVAFSAGHSLTDSLDFEDQMMSRTGTSADHRAAVDAFLAKEPPTFTGR